MDWKIRFTITRDSSFPWLLARVSGGSAGYVISPPLEPINWMHIKTCRSGQGMILMGWACSRENEELIPREAAVTKTNIFPLGAAGGDRSPLGGHPNLTGAFPIICVIKHQRLNHFHISPSQRRVCCACVGGHTCVRECELLYSVGNSESQWQDLLEVYYISLLHSFICFHLHTTFNIRLTCEALTNLLRFQQVYSTKALKPIDIPMGFTERHLVCMTITFIAHGVCFSFVL